MLWRTSHTSRVSLLYPWPPVRTSCLPALGLSFVFLSHLALDGRHRSVCLLSRSPSLILIHSLLPRTCGEKGPRLFPQLLGGSLSHQLSSHVIIPTHPPQLLMDSELHRRQTLLPFLNLSCPEMIRNWALLTAPVSQQIWSFSCSDCAQHLSRTPSLTSH